MKSRENASSKTWRKNEGLQVMFDEVLRRNTQLLREEQKELLWKQHTKRCNPSSKPQRKIDKALRKKYTIAEREGTKGSSIPTNRVQASSIGEKQ